MDLHNWSITFILEPHKTSFMIKMSRIFIVDYYTLHAVLTFCQNVVLHHTIII